MDNRSPDDTFSRIRATDLPPQIDRRAIAVGVGAGLAAGLLWRVFFYLVVSTVGVQSIISSGNTWLFVVCNLGFALVKGVVVGFISAHLSHSRPYFQAFAAILFLWITGFSLEVLFQEIEISRAFLTYLLTWDGFVSMLGRPILSVGGAFYGAYMAQSFERNRGVRID